MTHRTKLEKVLELLINEESEQASELLHQIIVEKARDIYGQVVSESDEMISDDEEDKDDEKVEEDFGGDMKDDFAANIEQDKEEVTADEVFNDAESAEAGDEAGVDMGDEAEEEQGELDLLQNIEAQLAALEAKIDSIPGVSSEEPEMGADEPMSAEDDPMGTIESIGEATKLSNDVAATGQEKEGKLAGTGKNSKAGSVNTKSLGIPSKQDHGGKAVQFAKKAGDGKEADKTAAKNPEGNNLNTAQKDVKVDASKEGRLVGTGKNSVAGKVNTAPVLAKK